MAIDEHSKAANPRPRRRFAQFSLLNLLLLTGLIATVMAVFAMKVENQRLANENKELRYQADQINIYDSTLIWGRMVPSGPGEWRWRMYFPTAGKWRVCILTNGNSAKDWAAAKAACQSVTVEAGECTIRFDSLENELFLILTVQDQKLRFDRHDFPRVQRKISSVVRETSTPFAPDDTIELLHIWLNDPEFSIRLEKEPDPEKASNP